MVSKIVCTFKIKSHKEEIEYTLGLNDKISFETFSDDKFIFVINGKLYLIVTYDELEYYFQKCIITGDKK